MLFPPHQRRLSEPNGGAPITGRSCQRPSTSPVLVKIWVAAATNLVQKTKVWIDATTLGTRSKPVMCEMVRRRDIFKRLSFYFLLSVWLGPCFFIKWFSVIIQWIGFSSLNLFSRMQVAFFFCLFLVIGIVSAILNLGMTEELMGPTTIGMSNTKNGATFKQLLDGNRELTKLVSSLSCRTVGFVQ